MKNAKKITPADEFDADASRIEFEEIEADELDNYDLGFSEDMTCLFD